MTVSRRRFFQHCGVATFSGLTAPLRDAGPLLGRGRFSREGNQTAGPIRLDNNENAYGPSRRAIQAIQESVDLTNRYPDSEYNQLLETIASLHGIKAEKVVLGCGSSEILRMAAAIFLGLGKKLIIASPTFDLISNEARRRNAEVVSVTLTKVYAHNLNAMLAKVDAATGLVYICNPNNPTGSLTSRRDLEGFLRKLPAKVTVVIDEAYHDYVGSSASDPSFLDRPIDDDRVIVVRTLSAIHGLAGLRIGYAVAAARTSRQLSALRLQSDVNVIGARAAVAALTDSEYIHTCQQRNTNDRQEFLNVANARMLRVLESQTNFVMLKTERHEQDVIEHFRKNNILLGPHVPSMPGYIRVSLGTPDEMKEFWRVWDLMPAQAHKMEM
jgi:histidinol-phosphate aminotransferase